MDDPLIGIEQLEHLERVTHCCEALKEGLPWMADAAEAALVDSLLAFDSEFWTFTKYLSLPLYAEVERLARHAPLRSPQPPVLTVVVPVFQAKEDLLRAALRSLRGQVGVVVRAVVSIDGRAEDQSLVERLWQELGGDHPACTLQLIFSCENRGVGVCRNRAFAELETDVFTCLDADDLMHPLRCLHGLLLLSHHGVRRVNTSFSRVSVRLRKIFLLQCYLSAVGHNSFFAKRTLLESYGFQADLRRHEDTEYMRRLQYFSEPIVDSPIVSHYLNMEADPSYVSLSTDVHAERFAIEGHPYLCGSIWFNRGGHRLEIDNDFRERYRRVIAQVLLEEFPAVPDP